jgi:glyoxylase-like metal-dependent hydrolase (beta-lactamase superfamily II)
MMRKLSLLPLFLLFFLLPITVVNAQNQPPASDFFTVQEVAPQVWALIVKPNSPLPAVCNGAFFTLGDRVAVVDSHFTPFAAREAARLIAAVTGNKPIYYLINTHWHPDHVQGNSTYSSLFPQAINIISHINTRRDIVDKEIPSLKEIKESLPGEIEKLRKQLQDGKGEDGAPLSDAKRKELETEIKENEALRADLQNLEITLPNLTFDHSMSLHAGEREAQVLYFGRGHTEGDVVVYLPKEAVVISGDLLTGGIPFMRDAYPLEWSATLAGVEKLNFSQVIPGHGPVQQGKDRLVLLRKFLDDLVAAVKEQVAAGKNLDAAKQAIKSALSEKYAKQFGNFNGGADGAIERAYNQLTAKQ